MFETEELMAQKFSEFLEKKIVNKKIDYITELVGVDGGGCVALTALGAIECGYKVTLIEDAIGTMLVKKKLKYNNKLRALGATFA